MTTQLYSACLTFTPPAVLLVRAEHCAKLVYYDGVYDCAVAQCTESVGGYVYALAKLYCKYVLPELGKENVSLWGRPIVRERISNQR